MRFGQPLSLQPPCRCGRAADCCRPGEGVSSPALYVALLLYGAVVGGAEVFRDNAAQTMLPALVPSAQLERANGQLGVPRASDQCPDRPALGGLPDRALAAAGLWAECAGLRMAMRLVAGLAGQFRAVRADRRGWRAELGEGFSFLRGVPLLKTLAWTTGFWNLFHQ